MATSAKNLGRPRAFDEEAALDAAMRVFWRDGYEGASLSELTQAMGINRPSLYAAFGDKEALFLKVVDRYVSGPASYFGEALTEPDARNAIERLLRESAEAASSRKNPGGCLLVHSALAFGSAPESIRQELERRRHDGETAIEQRLRRAKRDGDIPASVDVRGFARYITAVIRGMAVLAATGSSSRELQAVVNAAMEAWPAADSRPQRK